MESILKDIVRNVKNIRSTETTFDDELVSEITYLIRYIPLRVSFPILDLRIPNLTNLSYYVRMYYVLESWIVIESVALLSAFSTTMDIQM